MREMETNYTDCASVCEAPLFYLTRDISQGMPKKECLQVAIDEAIGKAKAASDLLYGGAILALISLPMAFPVCVGYEPPAEEDDADKTEEKEGSQEGSVKSEQGSKDIEDTDFRN